jgi:hypothetical protein
MKMTKTVLILLLAGCGTSRFANRHILWLVHDDRPIAVPKEREALLLGPGFRDEMFRSADRVLRLDYGREAANVNALDDVPDSSWFEDRRHDPGFEDGRLRPLSDAEMREGATLGEPPPQPPFTIHKGKSEGATVGYIVNDATGRKFLIKLDSPGWPRLPTSTEVVATRLVWSLGWRVPKIWLIDLARSDLVLAPDATTKNEWFAKVPLDQERLERQLRRLPFDDQHLIRAAASLWLPGKVIGPYSYVDKRSDDPNDLYPHQDRRDLRGLSVVCAWINGIDEQEINTLDVYVGEPGKGHLVHYQQDVGGAFGSRGVEPTEYYQGSERYFQAPRIVLSLATLGLLPRQWEGSDVRESRARELGRWPELGFFDYEHFDPRKWQPMVYNPAFALATARDRYWGAKRVAAFTERELRAAIAAGRYAPDIAERLFEVLWQRRRKILLAYFADVTSLDHFRVDSSRLCFDDLWEDAGLGRGGQYRLRGAIPDLQRARCVVPKALKGYRVVSLEAKRPGHKHFSPPVKVHLIDGNVVGVER